MNKDSSSSVQFDTVEIAGYKVRNKYAQIGITLTIVAILLFLLSSVAAVLLLGVAILLAFIISAHILLRKIGRKGFFRTEETERGEKLWTQFQGALEKQE